MFDSVLGRGGGAPRRPGVGTAVSLSLHALVFAVALLTVAPPKSPLTITPLRWPTLPRGASTRPSNGAESTPLKPHRPEAVRPRTTEPRPPVALETTATRPDVPSAGPADGPGSPRGDGDSASPLDGPAGRGSPDGVLVLGPEMVPPRLLLGPETSYPQAALLQQLGGTVVVRCTVTDKGGVQDCRVVKSVPLLDEAALQAVQGRQYAPALYEGRPVSVWMNFPVRFVAPAP
jgi:periplasmic protein TonB